MVSSVNTFMGCFATALADLRRVPPSLDPAYAYLHERQSLFGNFHSFTLKLAGLNSSPLRRIKKT